MEVMCGGNVVMKLFTVLAPELFQGGVQQFVGGAGTVQTLLQLPMGDIRGCGFSVWIEIECTTSTLLLIMHGVAGLENMTAYSDVRDG